MADFEIKHGTWESKDGKLIKYTKESCLLNSYGQRPSTKS